MSAGITASTIQFRKHLLSIFRIPRSFCFKKIIYLFHARSLFIIPSLFQEDKSNEENVLFNSSPVMMICNYNFVVADYTVSQKITLQTSRGFLSTRN